ncbi:ComEC/Rec2 family competence protein [Halalkalicoccus sp. NIPERK01]|uniref:ComEC/Rec2 family competence protein n=1 Tax=Halalkalicoccus sp. NIPERK01 TaxID=3053469 RepID=UPI00256F28CD|nr:ComEC/Rec2 family competence protein [Halalkalicoccus sp. NIPERK01]MDL5363858.1 ComEC/Rec2 family competence protein [Halalkalicoccus sp. NIPERK01]
MDRRRLVLIGLVLLVSSAGCLSNVDPAPTDNDTGTDDTPTDDFNEALEIHTINVGQADATLIIAPSGETMLIDSGDWPNDGRTVLAYLDAHDIDRIDHLVTTHGHADHIGGHAAIIEHYETERNGIGAVWDSGVPHDSAAYDRYLTAIEEHDVTLYTTQEGDEIPFDNEATHATVLNPPANSDKPDDLDYNGVVVLLEFGETSALFTGDAGADVEDRLLDAHGDDLDVDLYHAGHHGSKTSSTSEFLDTLAPQATIISSAYDSQYGHPHEESLAAFAERDIAAYWTAVHGTMIFESDGETWTVATQTNATTDPLALREEPEVEAEPASPPTEQEPIAARTTGVSLLQERRSTSPSAAVATGVIA